MSTGLTPAQRKVQDTRKSLRTMLEKGAQEFASVLPKHITPDRMIRIAMTACTVQPKLLDCTQESVALALLCASQTGLEPDGYHAHLVPYGKQCQFIPDYKGLIQLALENDVVIDAYAVYEKDTFHYKLGTQPMIEHAPYEGADRGPIRCAYAVAYFGNNRTKFVVATKGDIEKRRGASKATGSDSPWVKWEAEMYCKTAVKMLCKYIPRSQRLRAALVHDDTSEMGLQNNPLTIDVASARNLPSPLQNKTAATSARLAQPATPTFDPESGELGPFQLSEFQEFLSYTQSSDEVHELFYTVVDARKEQISDDEYAQALALCESRKSELAARAGG